MRLRQLCAIGLLPLAASCWGWQRVPGAALTPVRAERVDHARVSLHDGTVLVLTDATISADSIVGLGGTPSTRFAVSRGDVVEVKTQRTDAITSFLAGVLAVLGAVFLTAH